MISKRLNMSARPCRLKKRPVLVRFWFGQESSSTVPVQVDQKHGEQGPKSLFHLFFFAQDTAICGEPKPKVGTGWQDRSGGRLDMEGRLYGSYHV